MLHLHEILNKNLLFIVYLTDISATLLIITVCLKEIKDRHKHPTKYVCSIFGTDFSVHPRNRLLTITYESL
jgi:hypothetical protein